MDIACEFLFLSRKKLEHDDSVDMRNQIDFLLLCDQVALAFSE